jgi:hypothetical protein
MSGSSQEQPRGTASGFWATQLAVSLRALLLTCELGAIVDAVSTGDITLASLSAALNASADKNIWLCGDFLSRELFTGNEPTYSASDWSIHHE